MSVIAGMIEPGLSMEHEFVLPEGQLITSVVKQFLPNGSSYPKKLRTGVKQEFIQWCEGNLRGFLILKGVGDFTIRVTQEDYVLLKLKYFEKEKTEWQRII